MSVAGRRPSRISTESTSTVNSSTSNVDSARRRLREFYKLQEGTQPNTPPLDSGSTSDRTISEDDNDTEDYEQTELDEGMEVDEYVKKLVDGNDMKHLIKHEKALIQQLGALNSKKKALVYNNYNKLISASGTLQTMMHSESEENGDKKVDFARLRNSMNQVVEISKQVNTNKENQDIDKAKEIQELMAAKQAARWVLGVEKIMSLLKNRGRRQEAIDTGNKVVKLIDSWIENSEEGDHGITELSLIRERCAGMLSVL